MSDRNRSTTPANGNWSEQKEKLKKKFSILTDADLHYEVGRRNDMLTFVATKLGKTEEELIIVIQTL